MRPALPSSPWSCSSNSLLVRVTRSNGIVMGFILTNHSLSPHTEVNDPLINSLSVTGPRWFEWLTLGFGYHVELHLFPAISARQANPQACSSPAT